MKHMLVAAVAACLLPLAAFAAPEIGKPAPDFTGRDYYGKEVKLSGKSGWIVVLEWTNPECPFVRKHYGSKNMQKLQAYAQEKGVVWLTVNSSAPGKQGYMTADEARRLFETIPPLGEHYLLDSEGMIGHLYDAKTTPHMFVVDAAGKLVYMGAIDDKPTADKADVEGAKNYVKAAIDSLLAGTPVEVSSTQSYGCSVKYAE